MLITTILLLGSCAHVMAQQTWWVSNRGDLVEVDFTSINAAMSVASPGDTIMVYPSNTSYGNITINKGVHIVGTGYLLDTANQRSFDYTLQFPNTTLGNVTMELEASGASLNNLNTGRIIMRNAISGVNVKYFRVNQFDIYEAYNVNFIGCYLTGDRCQGSYSCGFGCSRCFDGVGELRDASAENIAFINCIFFSYGADRLQAVKGVARSALFKNCYFNDSFYSTTVSNTLFINNVGNLLPGGANSVAYHNIILSGNAANNSNGNRFGHTYAEVFGPVADRSFDLRYTLAPGSPALGAGLGGVDCGPYGGPTPYRPSGIYDRPLIYQLNIPVEVPTGQNMNVNVKVSIPNDGQ